MARQKTEKPFSDERLDELLKGGRTPADINNLLKQLTKVVVERAMQGEMTAHRVTASTIRTPPSSPPSFGKNENTEAKFAENDRIYDNLRR